MGEALDSHPASERGGRSRARGKWWRTGVAAKRMDARLQRCFMLSVLGGAPDAIMKACAQGMDGCQVAVHGLQLQGAKDTIEKEIDSTICHGHHHKYRHICL
jgi:hypothetical protein